MTFQKFAEEYELINEKARQIFNDLEEAYGIHAKLRSEYSYRNHYEYDYFTISGGYISLHGSYSYPGDKGYEEHELSIDDFINSDSYVQYTINRLAESRQRDEERNKERQKAREEEDYKKYLELKQKFEDK